MKRALKHESMVDILKLWDILWRVCNSSLSGAVEVICWICNVARYTNNRNTEKNEQKKKDQGIKVNVFGNGCLENNFSIKMNHILIWIG